MSTIPLQEAFDEARRAIVECTLAVFNAIDAAGDNIDTATRNDFAYEAWFNFVRCDVPAEDIARVIVRVAPYMGEEQVIDLIDAEFGDQDTEIELPEERIRVAWHPVDEVLILGYPISDQVTVASVMRRANRIRG